MATQSVMPGLAKALPRIRKGVPLEIDLVTDLELLRFSCERYIQAIEAAADIGARGPIRELKQNLRTALFIMESELGYSFPSCAKRLRALLDSG